MYGGAAGATLRGASHVRIGVLSLRTVFDPDGPGDPYEPAREVYVVQADPVVEIANQVLESADPSLLSVGDGIMTIHAINGEVSYGLREYDDMRETWLGVRSDVGEEDLEP